MKPGAVYMLYIPADLGYGDRQVGKIPAGSTLIFEVELYVVDNK
jgi:FKBP-type peptidyl-prolyl cis-trans isomerase